jgi:hypothetical protein
MTESIIDRLEPETQQFIVDSLTKGVAQRKISEQLHKKGVVISDMSIGRWWKENKAKYSGNIQTDEDLDAGKIITSLLSSLDKKTIKGKEEEQRLLAQDLLRELLLFYLVDIHRQTKLKQQNLLNHYPIDLISSLKVITDLYFKFKDSNSTLKDDDDGYIFT